MVRILGPDDEPIRRAHVHVSVWSDEPFRPQRDHYTDEDGHVEIELPDQLQILRVWARAPGLMPLFSNWDFERNAKLARSAHAKIMF